MKTLRISKNYLSVSNTSQVALIGHRRHLQLSCLKFYALLMHIMNEISLNLSNLISPQEI